MRNLLLVIFIACVFTSCRNSWQVYANELHKEGWSKDAATHIAKVEYKLIPIDSVYIGYKED